jgi:hypothetical protein
MRREFGLSVLFEREHRKLSNPLLPLQDCGLFRALVMNSYNGVSQKGRVVITMGGLDLIGDVFWINSCPEMCVYEREFNN